MALRVPLQVSRYHDRLSVFLEVGEVSPFCQSERQRVEQQKFSRSKCDQ